MIYLIFAISVVYNIYQYKTNSKLKKENNDLDLELLSIIDKRDIDKKTINNLNNRLEAASKEIDILQVKLTEPTVKVRKSRKES